MGRKGHFLPFMGFLLSWCHNSDTVGSVCLHRCVIDESHGILSHSREMLPHFSESFLGGCFLPPIIKQFPLPPLPQQLELHLEIRFTDFRRDISFLD